MRTVCVLPSVEFMMLMSILACNLDFFYSREGPTNKQTYFETFYRIISFSYTSVVVFFVLRMVCNVRHVKRNFNVTFWILISAALSRATRKPKTNFL